MNPDGNSAPLSLDELTSLAIFLAERGHPEALFSVLSRVALDVVTASLEAAR